MLFASQIADFGMARDVIDESYYMSSNGKLPVKWTAPEVCISSGIFYTLRQLEII